MLTPSTDRNWMLLLIDGDKDAGTGWFGYDYLVNYSVKDRTRTMLMKYDADAGEWKEVAEVQYRCTGGEIEVGVPRKLIGMYAKDTIGFDFKWCDNPDGLDDIITICTTGDTAPNRRFNYRFLWER